MKKSLILVLLIPAVLVLAAGCANKGVQPVAKSEPVSGSISDLMKLGKNYRCELQFKEGDQITSGTNYLSGDQSRSDYRMKSGEQILNGHAITTKEWMYSWVDEMPNQAVKINLADLKKYQGQAEQNSADLKNYDAKYDYKCYGWTPDQSKFAPPSGINFNDYSAMLKGLQNQLNNLNPNPAGATPPASACASCESISNAQAKAMCKKSLNCK